MLGIYNYYIPCDNHYLLNRVSYILQYSCAKTLAHIQKSSITKIFKKYGKNMKITRETYKNGVKKTDSVEFSTYPELKKKNNTKQ